jgi:hypothetical protein
MLTFVGIPAFFMEIIIGQYSGKGPLHVWEVVPIFKGKPTRYVFSISKWSVYLKGGNTSKTVHARFTAGSTLYFLRKYDG